MCTIRNYCILLRQDRLCMVFFFNRVTCLMLVLKSFVMFLWMGIHLLLGPTTDSIALTVVVLNICRDAHSFML